MTDQTLRSLRRESRAHAWRISASMSPFEGQIRLLINATRDTGAATELTSTAYLVAHSAAAVALAASLAQGLGCSSAAIVWGPPVTEAPAAAMAV